MGLEYVACGRKPGEHTGGAIGADLLDVGGVAEEGILRARIGGRQEAKKREGGATEKVLSKSSLEDLCRYYQLPPSFLDIDEEGILDEVLR